MKILYHHRTLSKDGQTVHIEELVAAFRRAGHVVEVVGPTGHAEAEFGSDGGFASRVRALLPLSVGEVLEASYSLVAFVRLWRAYRRLQPDLLYERYNLFLLAGAWLHRLTGVPFALEVNAPLALERNREPGLGLPAFAKWCEGVAWRAATLVLPVTKVLAEHVAAANVPTDRIMVIPNGISPMQFPTTLTGDAVRAQHGLTNKIVIGFTGFLRAWHGLPAVIESLAEMRSRYNVHFLVVGDGPARAELEQEARRLGVEDSVTMTGVVGRDSIPAYVATFDVAVQPKATAYASPLKLFEYMALGRAIVAPDQPNVREVLCDGANALLFSPADATSLKQALQRLVSDPALRKRLGDAAAATLKERDLTWDANAARITVAAVR